jgi:hypothetical protein
MSDALTPAIDTLAATLAHKARDPQETGFNRETAIQRVVTEVQVNVMVNDLKDRVNEEMEFADERLRPLWREIVLLIARDVAIAFATTPAPATRLLDDVRIGAFGVAAAQSRPLPLALVQRRAVTRRCQLAPNPPRPASQSTRECLDAHVPTVHAVPAVRRCEAGGTLPRRVA